MDQRGFDWKMRWKGGWSGMVHGVGVLKSMMNRSDSGSQLGMKSQYTVKGRYI